MKAFIIRLNQDILNSELRSNGAARINLVRYNNAYVNISSIQNTEIVNVGQIVTFLQGVITGGETLQMGISPSGEYVIVHSVNVNKGLSFTLKFENRRLITYQEVLSSEVTEPITLVNNDSGVLS